MRKNPAFAAISWGGLIAGILDILDPILFHWITRKIPPIRVIQSVASGLLGPAAFKGGLSTAALGLGLHFSIAFTAAAVYYVAARHIRLLTSQPVQAGMLYGLCVHAFMQYVVLPLSAFRASAGFDLLIFANLIFAHMFLVGLPIALATSRALTRNAGRVHHLLMNR